MAASLFPSGWSRPSRTRNDSSSLNWRTRFLWIHFLREGLSAFLGARLSRKSNRVRHIFQSCVVGARPKHAFKGTIRFFEEFVGLAVTLLCVFQMRTQYSKFVRKLLHLFFHAGKT